MTEIKAPVRIPAQALARARAYLLGRQCADGGFCFYRSEYLEESNPHDTWHALAALRLLGTEMPRRKELIQFVAEQPVSAQPYGLYFRVRSLTLLDHPDPEFGAVQAAVAALSATGLELDHTDDLAEALYRLRLILWLKLHFRLPYPGEAIARAVLAGEHPAGGFGTPPNLLDIRQALAVLACCGARCSARTRTFVASLAMPGFGFQPTAHSLSSNLETTCAGISCCRWLNIDVIHADDALAFILDCQTGNGGFARAPDVLPDIALTHLALAGLNTLAGPLHT